MKEGDAFEMIKTCKRQECEECGELATVKHTFLYSNARTNPASKAYRHDDCSWCADDVIYLCEECNKNKSRYNYEKEKEMEWCSTFNYVRMPHLFLFWEEKIK